MSADDAVRFSLPTDRREPTPGLRKTSTRGSATRSLSREGKRIVALEGEIDDNFSVYEDGPDVREGDFKKRQVFHGWKLAWLAYQSTGVIYGDIGTSPLYVYSSTFTSQPSYDDIVEVLSLIIWSLTIMVTIKYVLIILHADNEGEGGTFSTYSLLTRYANISRRDPREASFVKMERYVTGELASSNRSFRNFLEKSKFAQYLLKTVGVLAVSMVMSDGVLTPAQSVLGAVQGLRVVREDISSSVIVGTTCGILVLLFLLQPLGTSKLASTFAPIVIIWLSFNAGFGIYNLVQFDHSVLKAFSPWFCFRFFIRHKTEGWRMLGGILLAFTGVEALFADLGAFSRRAIQLSWLGFAYPCLLLAYIGQAAHISTHEGAYANPFFNSVPPGMLYPSLVVAVLAAIVASQAIITATFQLLAQIMKLSYCPQVKVVHTSKTFHGQLYVPFLNWILMCGTILVTAVYSNTTRLGNAYGVCVMFVTFFDTCLVTLVALIVWKVPAWAVLLPWVIIACVDGLYLSSSLTKVPDGAWFTLMLSAILACVFLLWRFGKEHQWQAEAEDRFKSTHLLRAQPDGQLQLTPRFGGSPMVTIRGFGIFFDKAGVLTPTVFTQFASKLAAIPQAMVFLHLRPLEMPSVSEDVRYTVSRFSIPGCYRLVVRHGYMDEVVTLNLDRIVYEQVRAFIIRDGASKQNGHATQPEEEEVGEKGVIERTPSTHEQLQAEADDILSGKARARANIAAELELLDEAYRTQILYVVGKEQMRISKATQFWRRYLLAAFLWIRDNTRAKVANWPLRIDRVVEVGFVKEV